MMVWMGLLVCLGVLVPASLASEPFVDGDLAFRVQRSLLQEAGESEGEEKEEEKEEEEEEKPNFNGIMPISKGPTRFYFENQNPSIKTPKMLLEVKDGIQVTILKDGREWDTFILDQEASGGITGSIIKTDTKLFQVDIDWKKQTFRGERDEAHQINGLQIEMKFDVMKGSYKLIELNLVDLRVQKERVDVELYPSTNFGYDIMAPLGLSFGCYRPGSFGAMGNSSSDTYSAKLTLPDMKLQVYQVEKGKFGPQWECGNMIPIGLWVCMLVTLLFAIVCAYGFTMLANINTMDRFDDPKGKAIYVPQTE